MTCLVHWQTPSMDVICISFQAKKNMCRIIRTAQVMTGDEMMQALKDKAETMEKEQEAKEERRKNYRRRKRKRRKNYRLRRFAQRSDDPQGGRT